ncbi:MAG: hypothetical protein ACLTDX_10810 [[Clostridium] innocuum]
MKASGKDIRRTIFRNKKRFCSVLIITALGVMMLSGLKAACDRSAPYSADQFLLRCIGRYSIFRWCQR